MINTNPFASKALEMIKQGYTVIPLDGKVPQVTGWQKLRALTPENIADWERAGWFKNIGMVTGAASNNVTVIDFDGLAGYNLFVIAFPELTDTLTVATGSGNGMHVYLKVDLLSNSRKVMDIVSEDGELINIEFKSDGSQVVIPPSIHPTTGSEYTVYHRAPIMHVSDLEKVWAWAQSLKPGEVWTPPTTYSTDKNLNPALLREIQSRLESRGFKRHGDWINTPCPNNAAHKNGDRTPSFGFNTVDGGANCYVCGGMSLKTLCGHLNFDPKEYGGIYERTEITPTVPTMHIAQATQSSASQTVVGVGIPVVTRTSRLTAYVKRLTDYETPREIMPVPFPLPALHSFGGMARVIKPGKLIGIVGTSGGGKTSLLETMVDSWLDLGVSSLVWSPEWDADEFIERATQRYGGVSTDDLYLHELFIQELQNKLPHRNGVELTTAQIDQSISAVRKLRQWETEVGYLDFPFLTVGHLQAGIEATLREVTFKPRVLIIDYVQLLHAMETNADLTMYNLLMRIKAICRAFNLVGVVATQVTKTSTKDQIDGKVLDSMAARYVNDDAFNLFITVNPDRDENGQFKPSAVLNIAKNSNKRKGKVRVAVDWERLLFSSVKHHNQVFEGDVI